MKGRPRLYFTVQLTLCVYLERFRCNSFDFFLFGCEVPTGGRKFVGLGQNDAQNVKWEKNNLLRGHFLTSSCVFWVIVREIISICLACAGAQYNKKAGRMAKKNSHKKCIFQVCVERPLVGGFQPNLVNMLVSRTLSNLGSFIVITWFRSCEVLHLSCCRTEPRPSVTLRFALPHSCRWCFIYSCDGVHLAKYNDLKRLCSTWVIPQRFHSEYLALTIEYAVYHCLHETYKKCDNDEINDWFKLLPHCIIVILSNVL